MCREHKSSKILTFITIITSVQYAAILFVFDPIFFACQTESVVGARFASGWAWHAFLPLFITIIARWAVIQAFPFKRKPSGAACYALRFRRTVARQTRCVTRCAATQSHHKKRNARNKNEKRTKSKSNSVRNKLNCGFYYEICEKFSGGMNGIVCNHIQTTLCAESMCVSMSRGHYSFPVDKYTLVAFNAGTSQAIIDF